MRLEAVRLITPTIICSHVSAVLLSSRTQPTSFAVNPVKQTGPCCRCSDESSLVLVDPVFICSFSFQEQFGLVDKFWGCAYILPCSTSGSKLESSSFFYFWQFLHSRICCTRYIGCRAGLFDNWIAANLSEGHFIWMLQSLNQKVIGAGKQALTCDLSNRI